MDKLLPLSIGLAVFLLLVYVVNRWLSKVTKSECTCSFSQESLFARNVELHEKLSILRTERYCLLDKIALLEQRCADLLKDKSED